MRCKSLAHRGGICQTGEVIVVRNTLGSASVHLVAGGGLALRPLFQADMEDMGSDHRGQAPPAGWWSRSLRLEEHVCQSRKGLSGAVPRCDDRRQGCPESLRAAANWHLHETAEGRRGCLYRIAHGGAKEGSPASH